MQAARIPIVIPDSRHVDLEIPKDLPVGPAEVIVLVLSAGGEAKPTEPTGRRPLGVDAGKGWIAEDFDAPLPDEIQRAFEA